MATAHRPSLDPVIAGLVAGAPRASFHQLVRQLQDRHPNAAPIGHQGPAARECVRLRPSLDLSFHSSDIAEVQPPGGEGGDKFLVECNFFGLYGTTSPLPAFYTEELLHQDEPTIERGFLDLFNHRLLSLFHRAWEKNAIAAGYRRDGGDAFSLRLLQLVGIPTGALPEGYRLPQGRLLGLAGLLAHQPHSVVQIEAALGHLFPGIPITLEPCIGTWMPVPAAQQNRLGQANCRIGADFSIGDQVFEQSSTFGIAIGPLPLATFLRFLPSGDLMAELRELVDQVNSDSLDWQVELQLAAEDVPRLCLEGFFSTDEARLGWTTWLGDRPAQTGPVRFHISRWAHG